MPNWAKWLSLILTGFLGGASSTQVDGSKGGLITALIHGGVGAGLAVVGGLTDTTKKPQ